MESNANQDPTTLALQIQLLVTTMEELTRQNQEMRQQLQQKDNRSKTNRDDDGDSYRKWLGTLEGANLDLLREMRKEMDELRNVIKEKKRLECGQNGQEDRLTLHPNGPGMPGTFKVSSAPARAIWWIEGSFGSL